MQDKKTRGLLYWGLWYKPEEADLFELIDSHRRAKGMTRKAFLLYAIANMMPELAPAIVEYLMARPKTKDAKAVRKDIDAQLEAEEDTIIE